MNQNNNSLVRQDVDFEWRILQLMWEGMTANITDGFMENGKQMRPTSLENIGFVTTRFINRILGKS